MRDINFDISGQVAVITGAGGIICGVMAREMAKKGAKVALLDLFVESAQKIADEINAAGGDAIAVKANVLDRASLEEARDAVVAKYGRIDVLINGAGGNKKQATVSPELDFFHLDVDAFKWVFDLNVTGAVLTTMVFGELLAKQGTGNVIHAVVLLADFQQPGLAAGVLHIACRHGEVLGVDQGGQGVDVQLLLHIRLGQRLGAGRLVLLLGRFQLLFVLVELLACKELFLLCAFRI